MVAVTHCSFCYSVAMRCPHCNTDLIGTLEDAPCPKCGKSRKVPPRSVILKRLAAGLVLTALVLGYYLDWRVAIGFWTLALFVLFASAMKNRVKWQRYPDGHCQSCGYNRFGVPRDAKCPECGKVDIKPNA